MQLLRCNSGIHQFQTQEIKICKWWFWFHLQGDWCWGCRGHDTVWLTGCHGFSPYSKGNFSNATLESINSKPKKSSKICKWWFWFHLQGDWCWGCRGPTTPCGLLAAIDSAPTPDATSPMQLLLCNFSDATSPLQLLQCNFSNATSPMQLLQCNPGGWFFISEVCHDCKGRIQMIDRLSVKNVLCKND